MIDQVTIERIIDTANIVDVIQDFVTLKKKGTNFQGLCPFHNEKTPSFLVSPSKNIFKCFGCGKGGNSVSFLMEHEHITYYEALKYLAAKYHIEITERTESPEDIQQKNDRESLQIVTSFAQKYFSETLLNTKEGKAIGLSYFRERGVNDKMIEKFNLGYCPETRGEFSQAALKAGYKMEFLVKAGLTVEKETGPHYDRFNGRVIFPIHSLTGKPIAFGGRTLKSDKTIAKYINSPETEIYHKSKVLYGIFQAKKNIIEKNRCYLVEGYLDVVSMHQAGIENVVASSGTSLTVEQIRLIKRFTPNITILYDGDSAGIKASIRGIDLILEEGMNVKVLLFPDGDDPDSYSRKVSSTELMEFLKNNEQDFISFKTNLLLDEAKTDPVKKAGLINEIVQSIALIPSQITRSVYVKECSTMMNIDEAVLYFELNKQVKTIKDRKKTSDGSNYEAPEENIVIPVVQPIIQESNPFEHHEKEIIRILLNYGALGTKDTLYNEEIEAETISEYIINELIADDIELKNPLFAEIFKAYVDSLENGTTLDEKYFINHSNPKISNLAVNLMTSNYDLSRIWKKHENYVQTEESKLNELISETVLAYKNAWLKQELIGIEKELHSPSENTDKDELIKKYRVLKKAYMTISKQLGNRTI